jgi:hypothetical protein
MVDYDAFVIGLNCCLNDPDETSGDECHKNCGIKEEINCKGISYLSEFCKDNEES